MRSVKAAYKAVSRSSSKGTKLMLTLKPPQLLCSPLDGGKTEVPEDCACVQLVDAVKCVASASMLALILHSPSTRTNKCLIFSFKSDEKALEVQEAIAKICHKGFARVRSCVSMPRLPLDQDSSA